MENEETIKSNAEQITPTNNDARPTISRRQFSLGLSGMVLAGTITLSTQAGPQKLIPHISNQPQYVLPDITASVWSPDSQSIATFYENVVMVYNAHTGKHILTYSRHTDEVLSMKWSADSKYLASSGFEPIVHVWNAISGQTVTTYNGHSAIVRDIAWSPNQQYLASAGYDKKVQVWEAFTGRGVVSYTGHSAEIQTLAWSPDGKLIASTDLQNRTMIWRVM